MLSLLTIVDQIQGGKHQIIKDYMSDKEIATAWTNYVNAQSAFIYAAVETSNALVKKASESVHQSMTPLNLGMWPFTGN